MAEEKTMQEEMNEVWMDSITENIELLIPKSWLPQINDMLPKLLNIVKMGMKKYMKTVSSQLGSRIFMIINRPVKLKGSDEIFNVPHYVMIKPEQIDFFQAPSAEFPNGEFKLKIGEVPITIYSFADMADKIQNYKDVKELIKDIQNGSFMNFTFPEQKQEQKQIGS